MKPFSAVAQRPIKPELLLGAVADPGCGGVDLFVGVVRDNHDGKSVEAVTYEAFEPLAVAELERIRVEAQLAHGARVAVAHRIGRLSVGEVSLAVAAACPHRAEAFAACRQVVEEIKKRLPVFKKEHYVDGGSRWLDGCALK